MDTYEKKYNEALERARQIKDGKDEWRYSDLAEITPALTEIFPELAESEDEKNERMRESLIALIKVIDEYFIREKIGLTREQLLDYLEKQKEPENTSASTMIPSCWEVEQRPAEWSEEDERILKGIIGKIDHDQTYGVSKKDMLSFLESLRHSWKPSEEQLNALNFAITYFMHETNYKNPTELRELYEQLKKL